MKLLKENKLKKTLIAVIILMTAFQLRADENLDVLAKWLQYSDVRNALYHHLAAMAYDSLTARKEKISLLQSKEDWQIRQQHVRRTLQEIAGPFPEKTPLNARIVGVLRRPQFHVEKIIFESQPHFYVTGCLFIPEKRQAPAPAVIYCSGHTEEGFRSETYQRVILNLTLKGFIVFAFDPVGQGERLQYYNAQTGKSNVGGPTKEHSYPGAQCFIAGSSLATYMIWDGIRAVDYLLSRPEVDPQRIGITGRSGGGTQSAYIAAFDDRIYAAAPECYITNFTRLLQSIGPQDAEQNFPRGIQRGIDHGDLVEVRAPKPTLLIGTTRDFFSIQGLLETYEEAKTAFRSFGRSANIALSLDDSTHASTLKNRRALYAFFQKHFGVAGDDSETEVAFFTKDELNVTASGQIKISLGGETVFSLNKKAAQQQIEELAKNRKQPDHLERVKSLLYKFDQNQNCPVIFAGRQEQARYSIEKYFLQQKDYPVPFVVFTPAHQKSFKPLILLSPAGKNSAAEHRALIDSLLTKGWSIVMPDLIGAGECGPGDFRGDAYSFKQGTGAYNIWFMGIQMGQSIVRLQTNDLVTLCTYLKSRKDLSSASIPIIAEGNMGAVAALLAAGDQTIAPVILIQSLYSCQSILENEYYLPALIHGVDPFFRPNIDLPDIAACLAPRDLCIINPTDYTGKPINAAKAKKAFAYLRSVYAHHSNAVLKLLPECSQQSVSDSILKFIH